MKVGKELMISIVGSLIASLIIVLVKKTSFSILEMVFVFIIVLISDIVVFLILKKKQTSIDEQYTNDLKIANEQYKSSTIKMNEMEAMLHRLKNMGITDCTEDLKGTEFSPKECMKNVQRTLSFMGVGGAKWVIDEENINLFKRMLKRVKSRKGKVRFLIINPTGIGFAELKSLRGENDVPRKESYDSFKKLSKEFRQYLEVRVYDQLPSFRLQFVDDGYVVVSRYYFEKENFDKSARGWDIPHLMIHSECYDNGKIEYHASLYDSFHELYEYIWENSKPLETLDITKM